MKSLINMEEKSEIRSSISDQTSLSDSLSDNTMSCSSTYNFLTNPDEELAFISHWMDQMVSEQETEMKNNTGKGIIKNKREELRSLDTELLQRREQHLAIKSELLATQNERKLMIELQMKLKKENENMKDELQELIEALPQLKIDADDKVKSLKDTYNSYNYASKFYQKYLNIYMDIENMDPMLFKLYFFTSSADSKDYSITIKKDSKEKWNLMDTTPKLPKEEFDKLQDKFFSDGNFRYLLCYIRKVFVLHRTNEKDKENKQLRNIC